MNKKQTIILWAMAILLCLLVVFAPKYYITCSKGMDKCVTWKEPIPGGFSKVKWDTVMQGMIVIIIMGCVSLYTFRDKKKPDSSRIET